jgi:cytidyltransferase-like protein
MVRAMRVLLSGSFDDLRSPQVRLLQEAARLGPVHVLLWSDEAVRSIEGKGPEFPQAEREYVLSAIRYVQRVTVWSESVEPDGLPPDAAVAPATWVVDCLHDNAAKQTFCRARGLGYRVMGQDVLQGFPDDSGPATIAAADDAKGDSPVLAARKPGQSPGPKRVIVTGCYDWLHSGHVRFFEEVSQLGDLYVVVGHDANIRFLKGAGHPMFPDQERRYMVQAIRFVKQALVATGDGWLDAEPQIQKIRPHIYAVNEDGDRPEKRDYCQAQGIEYRVLKRRPKEGLPPRQSTALRGF